MQDLAQYVMQSEVATAAEAVSRFAATQALIEAWMASKGFVDKANAVLSGGRGANAERGSFDTAAGDLMSWKILEEIEGGFFETFLQLARSENRLTAFCTIAAGQSGITIAPLPVDPRCPAIVSTIIETGQWTLGPTPLGTSPLVTRGIDGGKMLVKVILQKERTVPVVAISSHFGLLLHKDLPARMARALSGLALVTVVDDEAAWHITQALGKAYSCYGGAVRLYWPGFKISDSQFAHPLWTAQKMLDRAADVESAVARICGMLRRRLMATSVAALAEPAVIQAIRRSAETERLASARKHLGDQADYKALAESYLDDMGKLESDRDTLKSQLVALRQQLYRAQNEAAWADAPEELELEDLAEPATVEEAVNRARALYATSIVFGDDVASGVSDLAPDAGPPPKVFAYLTELSELAAARRAGAMGKGMILWLEAKGVTASTESETTMKNRSDRTKRTWHDGTGPRTFEYHLKPNDGVHPDRCVRIYFDWNDASEQIVIGWIGRHP